MWSNSFKPYSLRDLFHLKSSVKRHHLGRSTHKHKSHHYEPAPSRPSYYDAPYSTPHYSSRHSRSSHHRAPLTSHPPIHPVANAHRERRPTLSTLPPEIHLSLFDTLDPISSACLGLSSTQFYPMHRAANPRTKLYDTHSSGMPLCYLLKDWAPKDMVLDWGSEKLRKKEKEKERGYRNFSRKGIWEVPKEKSRGERYCLHEGGRDGYGYESKPKLRRSRRLDRHDIWYEGQRY